MLLFTSPTCAMKHLPKLLMCQHGQKANNMFCSLVCKWVFTQTHLHTPSSIVGIDQCRMQDLLMFNYKDKQVFGLGVSFDI